MHAPEHEHGLFDHLVQEKEREAAKWCAPLRIVDDAVELRVLRDHGGDRVERLLKLLGQALTTFAVPRGCLGEFFARLLRESQLHCGPFIRLRTSSSDNPFEGSLT